MEVIEGMIAERFEALENNMKSMIRAQEFDFRKETDLTSDRHDISNVLHNRVDDGFNGFDWNYYQIFDQCSYYYNILKKML